MSENVALPSVVCPLQWRDVRCRFAGVRVSVALLAVCCAFQGGCAAVPKNEPLQLTSGVQPGGLSADQFEYGRPNLLVDGTGWVLGIPSRLLLWNMRVDNHDVGTETKEAVGEYLAANELGDVKVRVNQYAPLDEWRRLRENDQIGAGWRYTFGTLNTLVYTVLPGRLFGGDSYNPYTNTIHLYSDVPALALAQGAYAKDVEFRDDRGWYTFTQHIAFSNLRHYSYGNQEAYAYFQSKGDLENLREAYEVLEPRYFISLGTSVGMLDPSVRMPVQVIAAVTGHARGRYLSHRASKTWVDSVVADAEAGGQQADGPSDEGGSALGVQHAGHVVLEDAGE